MAEPILVPQVGQDLTEATIVELHVKLGDTVKKGDLVAVVESEKASFDVEAFSEGVVIDLPYQAGDTATVLEPLLVLGEPGEVVSSRAVQARVETQVETSAPPSANAPIQAVAAPVEVLAPGMQRSSPIARRMAAARGLKIAMLSGTGPRGAVVLRDVEKAIDDGRATAVAPAPTVESGDTVELRTLQAGQGSPIVFVHGFGADLSSWRPMVGQLPVGLPILALDLPGHGNAAGHSGADFASIVEAVGATLKAEGGGLHLVGHSLGAAISVALTERGDLDIRSLTLLAPAGLGPSIDGSFIEGFLAARTEPALTAWMRRLVADPSSLAPVLVRATQAARQAPGLIEAQARVAQGLFEGSTQLFSVVDALRRFSGPATIVAGRDDAIVPLREVEAMTPANVALHRLPGVGHLPHIEAAELTRTIITRTVRAAG